MTTRSEYVAAVLRSDFPAFLSFAFDILHDRPLELNWHLDLVADHLTALSKGLASKLIINLPPRSLKSETCSIAYPAFTLGNRPEQQVVLLAGSQGLARELWDKLAKLLSSRRYRSLFPDNHLMMRGKTASTRAGGSITISVVGQPLIGRGADLIIIDDPLPPVYAKDPNRRRKLIEWFEGEVVTRFNNNKDASLAVLMQRVHPEDLTGYLLGRSDITWLSLPAIVDRPVTYEFFDGRRYVRGAGEVLQPTRFAPSELEKRLEEMGSFEFNGQYLQGTFYPWTEQPETGLFLWQKRPEGFKAGDRMDLDGGLFTISYKSEIKASYFGGISIFEDYTTEKWWTSEEFEAAARILQREIIMAAQG